MSNWIFLAIVSILGTVLLFYYAFRVWFDFDKFQQDMIRGYKKLPDKNLYRNYALKIINTRYYKWQMRGLTCVGLMSLLFVLVLVIRAIVVGETLLFFQELICLGFLWIIVLGYILLVSNRKVSSCWCISIVSKYRYGIERSDKKKKTENRIMIEQQLTN